MGSMKYENNKVKASDRSMAAMKADLEHIARLRHQEYLNSTVAAHNAYQYAIDGKIEYMVELVYGLMQENKYMREEINTLKAQLVKNYRNQDDRPEIPNSVAERYINKSRTLEECYEFRKQYCKGINILWNCGVPPVDIACNEFDIFRYERNMYTMIQPENVRQQWSTLYQNCGKIANMPLSRLLKIYADQRGLNY